MSITEEENEFDGGCIGNEQNLQWSPFKEYNQVNAVRISFNHNVVKSLIESAFPVDQEQEKQLECEKLPLQENVRDLTSLLYDNGLCDSSNETILCTCSQTMATECKCTGLVKRKAVYKWKGLLHSFFQKKLIKPSEIKWRINFFDVLSLDAVEKDKCEEKFLTSKKLYSVTVISDDRDKLGKPDPTCIYSNFGKLRNGFYVSSNGLVFSSEIELKKFNAKMAEMDAKLKSELCVIQLQHDKLKAKAEERKLLSQRTESHEESDQDDEPRENQQLNKESKPKDKAERKSGLFASLTASLSAARSGIQGFLEKSSPKEHRRSAQQVSTDDNEDSEDDTGKLTQSPDSRVPTVEDGIDNHDEFTRQMQAKGGLMYESADRTVQHLSHDALPPPLSLQALQAGSQPNK